MADGLSRPVVLYFSFLVFVLICLTGLSAMLIIATSLQLNMIRSDIEKASDKNATDSRVDQLLTSYANLKREIGRQIDIQSVLIIELGEAIRTLSHRYAADFKQIKLFEEIYVVKLANASITLCVLSQQTHAMCNSAISQRLSQYENDIHESLELHQSINVSHAVRSFFSEIEKIMLPENATILVKPGWQIPTLLSNRSYKMMPNQNEFLVHHAKDSINSHSPVRPTEEEYKTISLETQETGQQIGQFNSTDEKDKTVTIKVETILSQIEPNKLGHSKLDHQEIIPMIVYQRS